MDDKSLQVFSFDGSTRITHAVKVTGKGQVYFTNKFLADGRF